MKTTEYKKEFNKYKLEENKTEAIFLKMRNRKALLSVSENEELTKKELKLIEISELNECIKFYKLNMLRDIEIVNDCNNRENALYEHSEMFTDKQFSNTIFYDLDEKIRLFERLNNNQVRRKAHLEQYFENKENVSNLEKQLEMLTETKEQ
tara:strand:+ start:2248 stop:2700 length:453 start_codon:yes stop_codon:yes gene_type:complete